MSSWGGKDKWSKAKKGKDASWGRQRRRRHKRDDWETRPANKAEHASSRNGRRAGNWLKMFARREPTLRQYYERMDDIERSLQMRTAAPGATPMLRRVLGDQLYEALLSLLGRRLG